MASKIQTVDPGRKPNFIGKDIFTDLTPTNSELQVILKLIDVTTLATTAAVK
jgi:hypothetical protein